MARSVWKGPFVEEHVIRKAEKALKEGKKQTIKIWSRRSTVLPDFVGLSFGVHNGKNFTPVVVTEDMVGHKFGEFSPTRTYKGHPLAKKAKK